MVERLSQSDPWLVSKQQVVQCSAVVSEEDISARIAGKILDIFHIIDIIIDILILLP